MSQAPMSAEQFFDVFRAYNETLWPAPFAWTAAALLVVWIVVRSGRRANEAVGLFLAAIWAWAGIMYHLMFLAPRNPAAWAFGAVFVLQSAIFFRTAFIRRAITFEPRPDAFGITGTVLIAYAILLYPLAGTVLGHGYPRLPMFGVPSPTAIFTFGVLLWTRGRVPSHVLVIPVLWSLVAVGAAVNWRVPEDIAMPIAAFVASAMLLLRNRQPAQPTRTRVEREVAHAG